jgi:hypothetical protein
VTGRVPHEQERIARCGELISAAIDFFCERVGKLTDGKFEITPYAAGQIVPALQVLDAVQQGTVECGQTFTGFYISKNRAFAFGGAIPFGLTSRQQSAWEYAGGGGELLRDFYKEYGIIHFPAGNTGTQMGGWFLKEIKTVADLKGLKMRIGGTGGLPLTKLGVVPQQIAGGEDLKIGAAEVLVDDGTAGAGVESDMAVPDDRRLRLEAAGEDDAVAGDGLAPTRALDLDGFDLVAAADGDKPGARQHRHAEDMARDPVAGSAGSDTLALLQHGRDFNAAMTRGQQRREGHELGADDDGAGERLGVLEIDELLEGAGSGDAPGARSRHEARAARRLPYAGRQHDATAGDDRGPPVGVGHMDAAAGLDAGDSRARSNVDAVRRIDQPAGIGRTAHGEGEELAEAEPGVAAMAGNAAGFALAFEDDYVADTADGEAARGRQAGGSAADDDDVVDGHAALRIGRSGSLPAASSATRALQ